MEDVEEADISSDIKSRLLLKFLILRAEESSQKQIISSRQAMIDRNFKNFQSSMETTQKELSSSQLAKIKENIFGSLRKCLNFHQTPRNGCKFRKYQHFHGKYQRNQIGESIQLITERQKLVKKQIRAQ